MGSGVLTSPGVKQQTVLLNKNKLLYKIEGLGNVFDPVSNQANGRSGKETGVNLGILIAIDCGH